MKLVLRMFLANYRLIDSVTSPFSPLLPSRPWELREDVGRCGEENEDDEDDEDEETAARPRAKSALPNS